MWVWAILNEAQLDLFLACSLLLGLLMGLGLKVHVGHVLGLDPSYKPCWDHITSGMDSKCDTYEELILGVGMKL